MAKEIPNSFSKENTERFWSYVDIVSDDECWPWRGPVNHAGRGRFNMLGQTFLAPRIALAITNGGIPSDLHACHKCDNPNCVNPRHLWLGDDKQNSDDAWGKGRLSGMAVTHCPQGHEYTPENTMLKVRRRQCRECQRQRNRDARPAKIGGGYPYTHCKFGHPFTEDNTMLVKSKNGDLVRRCRVCKRTEVARHRARKRAG